MQSRTLLVAQEPMALTPLKLVCDQASVAACAFQCIQCNLVSAISNAMPFYVLHFQREDVGFDCAWLVHQLREVLRKPASEPVWKEREEQERIRIGTHLCNGTLAWKHFWVFLHSWPNMLLDPCRIKWRHPGISSEENGWRHRCWSLVCGRIWISAEKWLQQGAFSVHDSEDRDRFGTWLLHWRPLEDCGHQILLLQQTIVESDSSGARCIVLPHLSFKVSRARADCVAVLGLPIVLAQMVVDCLLPLL